MTKEELRLQRQTAGLSQAKLAKLCGMVQQRINEYEVGKYPISKRVATLLNYGLQAATKDKLHE